MPSIISEADLDDISKIGMLSLNSDTEERVCLSIKDDFNTLIQRSNDIVEVVDSPDQSAELLDSLLGNLTKAPSNPDNLNILIKCLSLIQESDLFLTQDITNYLVELLNVNKYPECEEDLCQILINSEHPLSEKQEKDLNDLLGKSGTEHLLNLLIEKEILGIESVENIIFSIKANANNGENNNLRENQLLALVKSLDKYTELKQKFQQPILDFFKEHDDSEFLAQIFRSINDEVFFGPINQELQQKLGEITTVLKIERLVKNIKSNNDESEYCKQVLKSIFEENTVAILQKSYRYLQKFQSLWSIEIIKEDRCNYVLLKPQDIIKGIEVCDLQLTRLIEYTGKIDTCIIEDYEKYFIELLHMSLLPTLYKEILYDTTGICWKLLKGQNNLSENSKGLLLSSLDKYQGDIGDHIQNVSSIIATLIDKKELPEKSNKQAVKLLTTYTGVEDKHIAKNISYCFKKLASDNVASNSFTEAICQQYLGSNLEDTTILQGLEYIIDNKGELPPSGISNLVEFSLNDEANDQDRSYGLKLISRVINQVTQEDIAEVSKLLSCSNALPDTEYYLQDTLQPGYLLILEEIQLDKYLAEQGLKTQETDLMIESVGESYGVFSNRFFESLSLQLANLGQAHSPKEIYQMTMESLRLASFDSAARPIIPLQEYYTSISGNLLSRETIQAAANVFGVNISIYNYDASVWEVTSCGEDRGEKVKIGSTNNNYFSLVRDDTNYSVATTDQITISSGESYDNAVPVSAAILKDSIRLLESYAKEYNMLPAESLASLKSLMGNPLLRADIVNILSYLISVSADQLDPEILDFITSNEPNLNQIVKFNRSISQIKELLNNPLPESAADQEDNSTNGCSIELEKIQENLKGNNENTIGLKQLKELYNLFELILKKEPASYATILSIIECCRDILPPHSGTIDQLLDLQKLTFADQCRLVKYGYRSDKLHNQVEEYFNNNLELISNDINDLANSVNVIDILSSRTNLSPETISSLIKIAGEEACSNKEYILKIIQKQNHILEDIHFVELEELFPFLKSNLRLLLAKLFVNNSRQVTSGPGIDAILEELTDSNSSLFTSILPEAAGQVGQIIVKLKSDIDVDDKLSALNELAALVSGNKERFITDVALLSFATQQQADQLRENFSQIYQEQLQYNDKAREVIRENHYPELEEIKNIIGESRYNIKSLTRQESLDSTSEPNTLGIDISLPHQINEGVYQYNYIITATNDCNTHDILELLSQRLGINKARLIQSPDNERRITIDKSLLENTIDLCDQLSIEAINQKIQLPETQPKNTQESSQASEVIAQKSNISDPMTDKNYWYNETDIQYIANGLIKEHNVTPALGTSENVTLKQLLEGVLEEYKTDYQPTFIPLNIRANHWVALCIFQHEGNEYAVYKDSLGSTQYKSEREQVEELIKEYNPDIIFKYHSGQEQEDDSSCGIFALQNIKIMSGKLLALADSRDAILSSADNWYPEIITTILKLLEHKKLTAKSMEILALAVDSSNPEPTHKLMQLLKTNIKANNIIKECRHAYPDSYSKLSPYLIAQTDNNDGEDIDVDDSKSLNASLELVSYLYEQMHKQFLDHHITGLDEIIKYLQPYQGNQQFVEDVLIKELIKKAGSPDEYCQFLALLNGSEVLESVIIKYIGSKDISAVTELIENELLLGHINELINSASDHSDIEAIKPNSVRQYVFWLKDNGWSFEGIVKLLAQIYKEDISITAEILSQLKKYKIGEEEINKQGKTVLDIINQYMNGELSSLADIEKAIHEIFSNNKFETKFENTGDELLARVEELNPNLADNFPEYQAMLNKVHDIYQEADESRSTEISKWNKDDIKEWADEIKSKYQNHQESHNAGSCDIAEMIAVVQRAYKLHTAKQGKEGHNLRDSQIMSLILLLEEYQGISIDPGNKGRLMQIATGEGKSIISASLAAILSLLGRSVDIITSSTVLAAAGHKNAFGFFEILGLSADINTGYGEGSGEKNCYGSDIVYGDNLTFQTDCLSNTSHQNYERGARPLDVVIVDEVDSMLLDGSNKMAKQSSPVPLMEYLSKAMAISWDTYQKAIKPRNLNDDRAIDAACSLMERLVEDCPIPSHLRAYAKHQVPHWAKSLVEADRYWNEDQHYVINVNEDGKKVINPVDNSTGVTEENMVWQNGLHQFLQIKHRLHLGSEGLTSFFISNIAYFKNYQKILGMTGTLGSESSQEFLQTIYDIDLAFMPTHKDKQLIELPPIVTNTSSSHKAAICENAYLEGYHHQRAVLIIGKNIQDVKEICEELKHRYGNSVNVINYSRSEESLYNNQIEQSTLPKTIIVATALAGRGTDIKTNREVEENGGLHVISTFIAKNARDEAQIIGRTARSGNSGTCCSIILDRSYNDTDFPHTGREKHIVTTFKAMRDAREQEYVKESIAEKVPSILAEDELYDKFSELYKELTDHGEDDNPSGSERQQRRAKINQLKEDFGLWLQTHSESESIEDFLAAARAKYNEGRFTNPSYPIIGHVGCGDGSATIEHLKAAIGIDDIYNFAAHYYTAQGWLQVGPKGDKNYKAKTIESLFETQNRIAELLSYLGAMNIAVASVDGSIDKENELIRQAAAKLGFFQSFAESLEKAVTVVQTCPSNKEVRVKSAISARNLDPALDDDDTKELSFLGVSSIFEVETYKPRQKWLDTIIVGICGIAQIAIGGLIAIGSLGTALNLAVGVMVEGVKDLYATIKAAANGVAIKFKDYLTEKAISYAVIAASCGIEKISASSSVAVKGGQAAATKAGVDTASTTLMKEAASNSTKEALKTELITKVVKKAGIELIKTVAIEHVVNFISEGINDGILGGLESRIEGTIRKSASNALNNSPILLSKDHNIEREQLLQEITQEISKKVKTNRNVHIISSLSSGIFSAVGKYKGIGTALYAAQKIGSVADAASKIEPIMDDMKDVINNVVARAASRAAERPKGRAYHRENTSGELDEAQVQMRDNMSSQIGSVVASYLMQSIQGKVTAPLVNVAVTAGANKILENYERQTQEELGILSTALAEKQMESSLHMQQQLGVTGNVEDVAGNRSIMLANAANDQAALPAIQEETALEINATDNKPSGQSMQQIAAAINQPLYLFEDGVLKASYGKGLNGAIIAVDHDSAQGSYRNLIQQDASNYRASQGQMSRSVVYLPDIYSALASGTQGKYTALDLLQLQQANYMSATAPRTSYTGVYDFFAQNPYTARNYTEYNSDMVRYNDRVSGDTDPVPLYDVARHSETGNEQYTDGRVKQKSDYPFSGKASSASNEGSFFSRIDFSPEQNGAGIGVAATDFYGRPVTRDSVVATAGRSDPGSGAEGFWSRAGYVVKELFGAPDAYGNPARPEAGAMAINSSEGYTDSRVRQAVDFPFVSRSGPGSGAGSFWSRIDFAPEQSGAGIRVAETDFYGRYLPSPSLQDEIKPIKIYDVKSGVKIDSNNHGFKKDSFVRNGKEVTSYRNSSGQFTKTPSPYNYSINTQIPLINLGGQEYSLVLIDSREITLGDTKVQTGMTAYTKSPYIFSGFNKGLNASMGWHSGILVGSAALGDGSNLSAHILETSGIAGFNVGKSGLGAKLGFKGSLANVKYIMPISEKCWIGYCFEGDATLEAGLGISAKAEIGLSNKKVKATLGGGAIAQGELSIDVSYRKNPEHILAQQKRTEQIQAKYDHFNNEIKHYPTHVIVKIAAMNIVDFSNPDDFESILTLAKTFSKK